MRSNKELSMMMAMVERRPIQRRTQQDWRYPYRRTNSSPFPFSSSVVDPAIFFFLFFSLYRAPNGSNCWLAAGRIPDTAIGWVMPPIWKGAPVEDIMGRIPEAIIGWKKIQKFHCRRDFFQRGGWGGLGSYYIPPRLLHDSLIQWTLINGISLQGKPDSSR